MPSWMRPLSFWVAKPWSEPPALGATFLNVPGAPVSDWYRPLFGDWIVPSASVFCPARQPTAASTAPALPVMPVLGAPCTTTSVTWLARKQPLAMPESPVQFGWPPATPSPVGSFTLLQLWPSSVERYRPAPVAA